MLAIVAPIVLERDPVEQDQVGLVLFVKFNDFSDDVLLLIFGIVFFEILQIVTPFSAGSADRL